MGWVNDAITELKPGCAVQVRRGGSMRGRIESGQLVTLAPVDPAEVKAAAPSFLYSHDRDVHNFEVRVGVMQARRRSPGCGITVASPGRWRIFSLIYFWIGRRPM